MVGESHMLFNINKTNYDEVIIRHFASNNLGEKNGFKTPTQLNLDCFIHFQLTI